MKVKNINQILKLNKMWYSTSYVKELDKASSYILNLNKNYGVIIFDIDDTLLLPRENSIPIPETVCFYNWIKNMGFTPVIITARAGFDNNISETIKELYTIGVYDFPYIFFRPIEETNIFRYKMRARRQIYQIYNLDIRIILNKLLFFYDSNLL